MGISVHAYALRLHLVFRLLCAQRHLHLQEMQWHFDSFLRRCVKVTSRSINWKMGLEEGFNVQIGYMRRKIQDKRAAGEATEEMVYDKLIRAMKMDSLFCSGRKIHTFYPETLKSCSTLSVTILTSNKLQQTVWTLCLNSVISGPAPGNVTHPSPSHLALAFMPFSVLFFLVLFFFAHANTHKYWVKCKTWWSSWFLMYHDFCTLCLCANLTVLHDAVALVGRKMQRPQKWLKNA